eukprot:CAMPEP_0172939636 /NCGR_PEP_ID=MMETSP1075-20121228/223623_1 /TAXON_ID=2916 /ORGANISM="Ceratium fusus, Strain PA161109" /LENGTH=695 /DNA_ID=CAMNT_0013801027 /DNA_START=101 /DNA_END=2188 /DNA_ORIENTATION=+
MLATTRVVTLIGLSITVCLAAPALRHARGHFDDWTPPEISQVVVASSLLDGVFKEGMRNASIGEKNVFAMAAAMQGTYQALPKNSHGLLSRSAAAYLVQKYTMKVYRYSIRGLGPDPAGAETTANDHSNHPQQTSVPEMLQSLLESHNGGHGLSLHDVASLAVMMRKLVMLLDRDLVYRAFYTLTHMNMFTENEELSDLSMQTVVKVIQAWDWLHWHDFDSDRDFYVDAMTVPTHVMDEFGKLAMVLMEAKFYRERHSRNPFKAKTLSLADTVQLAHEATQAMGMWQDYDCKAMKRYLIKLDPDNDGRVPLDVVHNQPEIGDSHGEQVFRFSESQDYLRSVGGLAESNPRYPQVLISNYVLGPANCYTSLTFHTFCCLNECDAVLTEVERVVGGPSAKPDVLLPLLGNLTTPSMDEPRPFSTSLVAMWQDHDCKAMKRYLIKLDPDNDGRVPLNIVHKQPENLDSHGEQVFRFSESQDYLRGMGGLDESNPNRPQVLISNYVLGPANCYKSLAFHTFCCLNECDAVLTEVERAVGGPSAKPDVLLPLLGNLTTPSMDEPRLLSESLVAKLPSIAAHSGGMVPLHGRLFTQWLHFAFPHECPYPHITHKDGSGNALTTSYFEGAADATAQWTDDEMLPLVEVDNDVIFGFRGILGAAFMLLAMGAMCNQVRILAVTLSRRLQKGKGMMGMDLEKGL